MCGTVGAGNPCCLTQFGQNTRRSTDAVGNSSRQQKQVRSITRPRPIAGYGAAYKAGLKAASGDVIITLDGDGSYPPEEIPRLVSTLIDRGWKFLSACRFPLSDPKAMGFSNRIGNWILTAATALLFFKPIRDSQSGMWVFTHATLERLRLTSDGMAFSEEIKLEALLKGLTFGETHIPYGTRVGTIKLRKWRDGIENLAFLVRKRLGWT